MKQILILLAALIAQSHVHAREVVLLRSPSATAPIVARADSSDPAVQNASPVPGQESGDAGWMQTEYQTTLEGHAPTAAFSKNFAIAPGTIIRAKPVDNASVLTVAEQGDHHQVIESNDDWTTIRFTKKIPVYFNEMPVLGFTSLSEILQPGTESAPEPDSAAEEPAPETSATGSTSKASSDPDTSVGDRSPEAFDELAPGDVVWRETLDATPIVVETSREAPQTPSGDVFVEIPAKIEDRTPPTSTAKVGIPMRTLGGKLTRKISTYGPSYPLRLTSQSGSRIAYIDMSRLFISDLRPFLNEQVYITGEVRPLLPGSRELIILARTIRLR